MIETIFNKKVYTEKSIKLPFLLKREVDNRVNSLFAKMYKEKVDYSYNYVRIKNTSNITIDQNNLFAFGNTFINFFNFIKPNIIQGINNFQKVDSLKITNVSGSFVLGQHKDSKVSTHSHELRNCKYVAVYYLNVPEYSGDLVMISDKKYLGKFDDEIENQFKHNISVENEMLIVHESDFPHAVAAHNSEENRISLVFEIDL